MFARVLRLRQMGVLTTGSLPPQDQWAIGIIEMSGNAFGGLSTRRRLILRDSRANPDKGLLFELYQPTPVDVKDPCPRFRGVEGVSLGNGEMGAMVQEWLVRIC